MNPSAAPLAALLLHCRPGFEKECAAEILALSSREAVGGYVETTPQSGYALFRVYDPNALDQLSHRLRFDDLIFPRQWANVGPLISDLPPTDRVSVLIELAKGLGDSYNRVVLETADTNKAKELAGFLRKFTAPIEKGCRSAGLLKPNVASELHLFFLDSRRVHVGRAETGNCSPWPMGIPRLKFPRDAPSRSTLKLEEAFLHFLGKDTPLLRPAMTAVDLGAAPGGWTWQLVRRSLRVIAIDNGPLAASLLDSGIVQHLRTDGFRYRPPKPVDWLVCDMVEQPSRIADLIASWLADGHCRQAIFNLKLPMKKRYEEVLRCSEIINTRLATEGIAHQLRFKQLYHDREEVTGYCQVRTGS